MRESARKMKDDGVIYTGFWEPPYFIAQLGRATQNTASRLDYLKSEDFVKYVADLGVNHLWCNFSKGYGLVFEEREQLKIRSLCEHAKKHGLYVIAYCTGGSLTPETLKRDFPENPGVVDDMVARRADGRWASYGNGQYQCFRARPDYTSPEYRSWQLRVIDRALDYGCDGIHFDNTNILPEPAGCRCERCRRLFREFLERTCGPGDERAARAGLARWGTNDFTYATVPWYDEWNDPVMQREIEVANHQAWLLFRQQSLSTCLSEWADHIHARGGVVEYNCGKTPGSNYRAYGAIVDEVLLEKADLVFNEGTYKTGYNASGAPLTRVRSHKIAQAFGVPMMSYNASTHLMAEAFSFNPGMCGMWRADENPADCEDRLRFFRFYHRYKPYQTRQRSLAEAGVYMQHESLTFSTLNAYMAHCSVTQLLQEQRVPFDLLYRKDLAGLSRYRLVIVAEAHCLKEDEAEALSAWVRSGGRLLTIGRTGTRDDFFRLRTAVKEVTCPADLYRCKEVENVFTPLTGEDYTRDFIKEVGEGMAAHVAALEYSCEPRHGDRAEWNIRADLVNRPVNADAIMVYVDRMLGARRLRVATDRDLLVDLCRRDDTGEGLVHLFNVSWCRREAARAEVEFAWDAEVTSLTLIGWDRDETPVAFSRAADNRWRFGLDGIRESAVVIVNKA